MKFDFSKIKRRFDEHERAVRNHNNIVKMIDAEIVKLKKHLDESKRAIEADGRKLDAKLNKVLKSKGVSTAKKTARRKIEDLRRKAESKIKKTRSRVKRKSRR